MYLRALILALLPVACGGPLLKGNGDLQREDRTVGAYLRLELEAPVQVDMVEGGASATAVKCDSNLLEHISTEIVEDLLIIRIDPSNATFRPKGDCVVIVRQPKFESLGNFGSGRIVAGSDLSLKEVRSDGSGETKLRGISADSLTVTNNGSGRITSTKLNVAQVEFDVEGSGALDFADVDLQKVSVSNTGSGEVLIRGKSTDVKIVSAGSGIVVADALVAANGRIENTGSGMVKAHVTAILDVENTGSGEVRVTGSPTNVTRDNTGSGSITIE